MDKKKAAKRVGQKSKATRQMSPALLEFRGRLNSAVDAFAAAELPSNKTKDGARAELARRAGVSPSTITKALNEVDRDVSFNVVLLLTDALRHVVNPFWLLTGQGPNGIKGQT